MMSAVYAMVSPVLSAQTRDKVSRNWCCLSSFLFFIWQVRFLDKDWKNHLIEEIGEENIFMHWGGSKKSENPCGDIRMGGKVPEALWLELLVVFVWNVMFRYNDSHKLEGDRTKVSVGARTKAEVSNAFPTDDHLFCFQVKMYGESGKHFHWLWRVSSGDIDFSIEKDGRVVSFNCLITFTEPDPTSFLCQLEPVERNTHSFNAQFCWQKATFLIRNYYPTREENRVKWNKTFWELVCRFGQFSDVSPNSIRRLEVSRLKRPGTTRSSLIIRTGRSSEKTSNTRLYWNNSTWIALFVLWNSISSFNLHFVSFWIFPVGCEMIVNKWLQIHGKRKLILIND